MIYFAVLFGVITTFISIFLGVNIYAAFGRLISNKPLFWAIVILISQSYIILIFVSRLFHLYIPGAVHFVASSIFAIVLLGVVTVIFVDIFLIAAKYIPFLKSLYYFAVSNPVKLGIIITSAVFLQFFAGLYMASHTKYTYYTVYTSKLQAGSHFRVVQLTDTHVTSFTNVKRLEKVIEHINSLKPDLVVFTGDIIDLELEPYERLGLAGVFSRLSSKYGSYLVTGNHEYYGMVWNKAVNEFRKSFTVLLDEQVYIPEINTTIAGRVDLAARSFALDRKPLDSILKNTDKSSYIIVLDHQPKASTVDEAEKNGADLMFSGHTHNGQFFPASLIVKMIYPKAWGILERGTFNLIVSCGYGTWGPPVRLGSYSEVVVTDIYGK